MFLLRKKKIIFELSSIHPLIWRSGIMAVTGKDLPDIKDNCHSIHSNPDMIRFTSVTCSEYSVTHDRIQDYKKTRAAMNRFTTGEDGICLHMSFIRNVLAELAL